MMVVLAWGLFVLLIVTAAGNLLVPFAVMMKARRGETGGVSTMLPLNVLLLAALAVLAALSAEDTWIVRVDGALPVALGVVVGSFALMWLLLVVLGRLHRGGQAPGRRE